MMYDNGDLSKGQPKRGPAKKAEDMKSYFKLGKTAANLEQQREENRKEAVFNIMQQAQLQQAKNDLKDILADIQINQKALDAQMQMMMGASMPPDMGMPQDLPGGLPQMSGEPPPPIPEGAIPEGAIPAGAIPAGAGAAPPMMM